MAHAPSMQSLIAIAVLSPVVLAVGPCERGAVLLPQDAGTAIADAAAPAPPDQGVRVDLSMRTDLAAPADLSFPRDLIPPPDQGPDSTVFDGSLCPPATSPYPNGRPCRLGDFCFYGEINCVCQCNLILACGANPVPPKTCNDLGGGDGTR